MAFLTKDDIITRIQEKHLDQITEGNDGLIDDASATAQATIRDSLFDKYDCTTVFAATGDDRNKNVLRWMIVLTIYYLYERIPDKLVPERVVKNYDDTLGLLLDIQDGKKGVDLPRLIKEGTDGLPKTKFRYGGEIQRTHDM